MSGTLRDIALVMVFILVGSFFVVAEMALVSLRDSQAKALQGRGRRGEIVAKLNGDPNRFLAAVRGGDLQGLLDVLAPDVVVVADGGGMVSAAPRPIVGSDKVAGFLSGLAQLTVELTTSPMWLNGAPAARVDLGGELDTAMSLVVEDGRITRIYAVRNPQKMARLDEETALSR